MELQETIHNLHILDGQLWALEDKYGVLSSDFYQAMMSGALSEFDGEPGYHEDFLGWLASYEMRKTFERTLLQDKT